MKNVVLNIIYKFLPRLELPSAARPDKGDEDSCWCLAASRRMSGPAPPMSTVGHHLYWPRWWPWDLATSHQWSQEASWQLRQRLIRLHICLNNKFTFIPSGDRQAPISPSSRDLHQRRLFMFNVASGVLTLEQEPGSQHKGATLRLRVLWTPRTDGSPEAPSDASGLGQNSWTLSINPPSPLSPLFSNLEFALELQDHYGQKSSDSNSNCQSHSSFCPPSNAKNCFLHKQ